MLCSVATAACVCFYAACTSYAVFAFNEYSVLFLPNVHTSRLCVRPTTTREALRRKGADKIAASVSAHVLAAGSPQVFPVEFSCRRLRQCCVVLSRRVCVRVCDSRWLVEAENYRSMLPSCLSSLSSVRSIQEKIPNRVPVSFKRFVLCFSLL